MELLVSVRSVTEASAALAGGAHVIDAKEPSLGALGPVDGVTLREIAREVPRKAGFSVAAGEGGKSDIVEALAAMPAFTRRGTWFKFAMRGTATAAAEAAVTEAVGLLRSRRDRGRLVLGRYADEGLDDLDDWMELAARAGVDGFLVDTRNKRRGMLLANVSLDRLDQANRRATSLGLWLGLAGRLGPSAIAELRVVAPRFVGVRGAACDGGRDGAVSPARVRRLLQQLGDPALSLSVHPPSRSAPEGSPAQPA